MFNTLPYNSFPASTAKFEEGKNDAIQAEIDAMKDGINIDSFGDVEIALATKTNLSNIAPTFDATSGVYEVGDKVIYDGVLYEFTSDHSTAGEWDESEVQPTKVSELIDTLNSGLTDIITEHVIETVAPHTYTDNKTALLYLYTKYSGLSDTIKAKCYIKLENNYICKNCDLSGGVFARTFLEVSGQNVNILTDVMSLSNGRFSRSNITGSTCSVSDFSATSQNLKIELCY